MDLAGVDIWPIIGWVGTSIFVASFLVRDRSLLHLLGLIGCVVKLIYTLHYQLTPLVVNWVLLIVIEAFQWWRFTRDHSKPTIEERINCNL